MALKLGANVKVAVIVTAVSGVLPGTAGKYLFTCSTDMFIRFAGATATVSAFDVFMPKGSAFIISTPGGADISAISNGTDGTLVIHEID